MFVVVAAANCSSTLSHSTAATVPASGTHQVRAAAEQCPEGVRDPLSEETGVVLVLVVPHRVLPPLCGVRACVRVCVRGGGKLTTMAAALCDFTRFFFLFFFFVGEWNCHGRREGDSLSEPTAPRYLFCTYV